MQCFTEVCTRRNGHVLSSLSRETQVQKKHLDHVNACQTRARRIRRWRPGAELNSPFSLRRLATPTPSLPASDVVHCQAGPCLFTWRGTSCFSFPSSQLLPPRLPQSPAILSLSFAPISVRARPFTFVQLAVHPAHLSHSERAAHFDTA